MISIRNNKPPSHYGSFLYYFLCASLGITYLHGQKMTFQTEHLLWYQNRQIFLQE